MPQTIHNKTSLKSSNILWTSLVAVSIAALALSLTVLSSVNISSRSNLVGFMLGLMVSLLLVFPFLYNHFHRRILSDQSLEFRQQVRANLKLYATFLMIVFFLSVILSFIHKQYMVVLK